MRAWRLLSLLVALAGCVQPQQVGLTPCDELAQPPRRITGEKPLRPPGIAPATINAALAEPACRAAIAAYPEEPRFHYQLALALNRLERPEAVMASFRRAAELGYAPAQADLGGNLLARQLGMPQAERTDVPEGLRWLRLAAAQGDRRAYYQLTRVYFQYTEKTRLIPEAERHPDEAMALLRRAVELGRDWAQYQMAEYAFTGTGLPQDPAEAVRLYRLSAAQGYPAAQIRLGTLLDSGAPGLAQDTSEAARMFRLAADQGAPEGQLNLGIMLLNGRGVAKNDAEAEQLFRLAARQGNRTAQQRLRARGVVAAW